MAKSKQNLLLGSYNHKLNETFIVEKQNILWESVNDTMLNNEMLDLNEVMKNVDLLLNQSLANAVEKQVLIPN